MWRSSPRPALVTFALLFCSSLLNRSNLVRAGQVNITVDDSDSSILYQPTSQWVASVNTSSCKFCLVPSNASIAFRSTWHHGLHIIPTSDADDAVTATANGDGKGNGTGQSSGSGSGKGGQRRRHRRAEAYNDSGGGGGATSSQLDESNPFVTTNFDSDDAAFVDNPVFFQFNFTGSAIYLYCLLPLGLPANSNSTPTLTNLTYTLDGEPAGGFLHNGSAQSSGFEPRFPFFTKSGLSQTAHTLRVNLGPDSVLLFDSYVFTQTDAMDSNNSPSASTTETQPAPSTSPSVLVKASSKKHNIATFAGAVGGSVGLLSIIAACLAFSIYRRRVLSARRQRREQRNRQQLTSDDSDIETFHTDGSEDGPPMQGPAPFVPRFFPGTVPVAPPPYIGHLPTTSTPLLDRAPSVVGSYADRPPPTPTMGQRELGLPSGIVDDVEGGADMPPPFIMAIASPEPPLLANISRRVPVPMSTSQRPVDCPGEDEDRSEANRLGMATETGDVQTAGSSRTESSMTPSVRSRPPSFRSLRSLQTPLTPVDDVGASSRDETNGSGAATRT
ncbi:hypothetical protein EW146_g4672 [Bondarzewia mesenterica]|uniref:Uncharacterized protein n=1 Tax=Bondarzewia mesenterica TaxID=1095465 RepID=A0A4S4LVN9_9AGAM|nr:hypothetical protein EW146_g4672 [Bondarzewia mesenterica]